MENLKKYEENMKKYDVENMKRYVGNVKEYRFWKNFRDLPFCIGFETQSKTL